MDAIEALLTRNSSSLLYDPAPEGEDRKKIFQAALRAPDHALLRPWRFLCVEGERRGELGKYMEAAAVRSNPGIDEKNRLKRRNAPLRAPLVVIAVADVKVHAKVPEIEQLLSVGSAINNMLVAAHALGFAGMWRTGELGYDRSFMRSISLRDNEHIVGFLYLGSANGKYKPLPQLEIDDFFSAWALSDDGQDCG